MRLWSIVLAAGRGRRLSSITGGVPKQFWSPDGNRSLLEDTLMRIAPLTPEARTVTVVDRSHRSYMARIDAEAPVGRVVYQPGDAGTAAGVLLGMTTVVRQDPEALVLITPSDHGVEAPHVFQAAASRVAGAIQRGQADVVLFGVRPQSAAGDYGWITPAAQPRPECAWLKPIAAFVEKPASVEAERLFRGGAAWNTMVMVARAGALLDLYHRHLPALAAVFDAARGLDAHAHDAWLADAYPRLTPADFSRDLVAPASGLDLYTWPASIGWTDLGTPDRLAAWLAPARRASESTPAVAPALALVASVA